MPRWDCGYARKELQKRGRSRSLHYLNIRCGIQSSTEKLRRFDASTRDGLPWSAALGRSQAQVRDGDFTVKCLKPILIRTPWLKTAAGMVQEETVLQQRCVSEWVPS